MNNDYQGMKWLKCDLQVQTPADAMHWQGDKLVKGEEHVAAKKFAEACYELGLDLVGITEHNFLSKDFLPFLKNAFDDIYNQYNHRITMLPGFEFEAAGVGKGVHVLCLFNPDTELDEVDSFLTECGVGVPRVKSGQLKKSDMNLKDIIRVIQNKHNGIVIMPHATSNDGIFDNEKISEWVQQDQFLNTELLAIEIPKPVSQMSKGYQKLILASDDCQQGWKRDRPIATIMSSDNKCLIKKDSKGRHEPNSLGYRYTWIKMSHPSIESLRQAFLDHSSRIRLPEDVNNDVHPNKQSEKNVIKSISIKNASFLKDQEIHFSPYLNCIIGGRGSGKSTLIECLRIAFKKDNPPEEKQNLEKTERIKHTLNSEDAEIKVQWQSNRTSTDSIIWNNGKGSTLTNRSVVDSDKYFNDLPISFYSQQQLNDLSESVVVSDSNRQATGLLSLIDSFIKDELSSLQQQEREIVLKIKKAFADQQTIDELVETRKSLEHDIHEINLKLSASESIEEAARRYEALSSEKTHIDNIKDTVNTYKQNLKEQIDRISQYQPAFNHSDTPNSEWVKSLDTEVASEIKELTANVNASIEKLTLRLNRIFDKEQGMQVFKQLENASNEFEKTCLEKGMSTEDAGNLSNLQAEGAEKQALLHEKEKQIERERSEAESLENLMIDLHGLWHQQYELRSGLAERKSVPKVEESIINVIVTEQADYVSFMQHWQDFSPSDKRKRLGANWESIGRAIYNDYVALEKKTTSSPWEMLNNLLNHESKLVNLDFSPDIKDVLYQHIVDNSERWLQLRCKRVLDSVDIELFRNDGSRAGSISKNDLSDGQRNTAVLALLLSEAGNPLVIDQPEDELDSNFVYNELIPLLRNTKHERQLIIATHNANLPVNGDAELVYAFDVENGRGVMKACGGLDNPKVTSAILDIMEGSEEAFKKRREKYNF